MVQNFHEASKHDNCFWFCVRVSIFIMVVLTKTMASSLFRVKGIGPFVTISFSTDAPKDPQFILTYLSQK